MLQSPVWRLCSPHRFIKGRLHSPAVVSVLLKTWSVVQVDKKGHDSLTAGVQQEWATEWQQRGRNPLLRHSAGIKGREQTCALTHWQTANQLQLGDSWDDPSPRQDEAIRRVNHLQSKNMICPSDAPVCVAATPSACPPGIHLQLNLFPSTTNSYLFPVHHINSRKLLCVIPCALWSCCLCWLPTGTNTFSQHYRSVSQLLQQNSLLYSVPVCRKIANSSFLTKGNLGKELPWVNWNHCHRLLERHALLLHVSQQTSHFH